MKSNQTSGKRIYYFDNLKIALTCLVVAHHASQGYFSVETGWPVQHANIPEINDRLIGWFTSVNNAFFMALFFMISAYFIPLSLEHKSSSKFWSERLKKFGIPIVVITCFIFPFTGFFLNNQGMSLREFAMQRYFKIPGGEINLGQTWFLLNLLVFTGIYFIYKRSSKDNEQEKKDLKNVHLLLFAMGLTVITFIVRIFFAPGYWTALHGFEPARIATYFAFFCFGIRAFRRQWFERMPVSMGALWGVVSIVAILLVPPIVLFRVGGYSIWAEGISLNSIIVSAWETLLCTGLCISLPLFFRQKFNFTNNILNIAAKSSFGVFLIHPFILIPMQILILNMPIHPFLKFIVVSMAGIVISYLICYLYNVIKSLFVLQLKKVRGNLEKREVK